MSNQILYTVFRPLFSVIRPIRSTLYAARYFFFAPRSAHFSLVPCALVPYVPFCLLYLGYWLSSWCRSLSAEVFTKADVLVVN